MRYRELLETIDGKLLSKAEADGFDTSTIYYHGTTRKFKNFKKAPNRKGVNELGHGVYVTDRKWLANTWARENGWIAEVVIRKGPLFNLDQYKSREWWDALYRGHCRLMRDLYGENGVYDEKMFKEMMMGRHPYGEKNKLLGLAGYIGGYDARSQIAGQLVIFRPEDARIVGWEAGKSHMTSRD